jgi:PAS domain S-box-containing protein
MTTGGTILVVDDTPDAMDLQVELLSEAGYGVLQAQNGEQALAIAATHQPDLVLLDVFMADMDGYEVCRRLKAREDLRHIPIILISAFAGVKALAKGLQLGAADYLTKPFQTEELLVRVQTHLSLGRAYRALAQQAAILRQANDQLQVEISERRRAEEEVARMAREWQTTFGATNDAIWLLDAKQRVVRANKMAEKTFPRPCGDEHCWEIVHGTSGPVPQCPIQRARKSLRRETMELQIGELWYQITGDPILDDANQYVGAVHIARDITERKRAQAVMAARLRLLCLANAHSLSELLQATLDEAEALTNSQVGFYHFVEPDQLSISLQAWSTNTSLRMCQAEGAGRHYPLDQAGVWGDCIRERRPVIHNDYASLSHRKGLPKGHAPVIRELVVPVWRGDLMVAVLGVGNKPADYHERDVQDVAALADLAWDIAENKRKEAEKEKLEGLNRQLQKSESLGRMAGAIAHHFNNQLQAVMMNLELVSNNLAQKIDVAESLADATASAEKAATVSRMMLTYLGQNQGKREPLDLAETCLRHLPLLRAGMPRNVDLTTHLPSPGPIIHANENQIQQVLANLLTNAWEACQANGGGIRLAVKVVAAGAIPTRDRFPVDWEPQGHAYACLEVSDAGAGITARDIDKIFDPFFSRKFAGRGLGLPVVLGILRFHGGGITVESELGRGSVFRVFLPMLDGIIRSETGK